MIHFRLRYETVRDQLAWQRARVGRLRAAWRSVALVCLGLPLSALVTRLATDRLPAWAWFGAGSAMVLAVGALWMRDRARARREASPAWLDRRLALGELLVTAVEVDKRGPRTGPERWLLDDAATALAEHADLRHLGEEAVHREGEALIAALLVACGLALAWGWLRGLPPVAELGPAGFGGTGMVAGGAPGAKGAPGSAQRPDLQQVAQAWSDHAALRPAARSLSQGDAPGGARALRALADRSGRLSPQGSRDLADALARSASALSAEGESADVVAALEEAGAAMRAGDMREQADALEDLARAIESGPAPGGASRTGFDEEPREREGPPAERLDVSPSELSMPGDGDRGGAVTAPPSSSEAQAGDRDIPGSRPAGASAAQQELDADRSSAPGRVRLLPIERETVRLYFQRAERGSLAPSAEGRP